MPYAGLLQGLAALTNMSLQLAVIGLQPKPAAAVNASSQRLQSAPPVSASGQRALAAPAFARGRRSRSGAQTAPAGPDGNPPYSRRSAWSAEHLRNDVESESLNADGGGGGGSVGTVDVKSRLASAIVRELHRDDDEERPGFARELASAVQKGRRLGWLTLP